MESRGTDWQLLHDYQFKRIDTFLDLTSDPLGAGYNIAQAQIALGSGAGRGAVSMQGTQSRLNFLPEKHTDFIFTSLAEEFGFVGAFSLLMPLCADPGFLPAFRADQSRPFCQPDDHRHYGDVLSVFLDQYGDGDGDAAGQGVALAAGQLWGGRR